MQYKYTSLRAVLNYIPNSIREEESESNLLSWAFQGLRENSGKTWKYNYEVCLTPLVDHKASIPSAAVKIAYVGFSTFKPWQLTDTDVGSVTVPYSITKFLNKTDENDYRVIIQQQAIADTDFLNFFAPLRYMGQNPDLLTKKCMNLYCRDCSVGFSISKDMSTLVIDTEKDGWTCIIYKTLVRDEAGKIMIPDDPDLLRAMGFFAQALHWLDRDGRKEQGAGQRFERMMSMATSKFSDANVKAVLRALNPNYIERFISDRFLLQKHPVVSGQSRNRWYSR